MDLRKDSTSNLSVFTGAIEKVMKLYEEQRNDKHKNPKSITLSP